MRLRPVDQWRKAIVAALIAAFAAAGTALVDGSMTAADWCLVAGAALVAGNGVYWTPNAEAAPAETETAPDQLS